MSPVNQWHPTSFFTFTEPAGRSSSGTAPRSVLVPGSVPNGHDGDRTGDVFGEVFQVAGVTCEYVIAATSGGLDDDGINDIGGSGAAA